MHYNRHMCLASCFTQDWSWNDKRGCLYFYLRNILIQHLQIQGNNTNTVQIQHINSMPIFDQIFLPDFPFLMVAQHWKSEKFYCIKTLWPNSEQHLTPLYYLQMKMAYLFIVFIPVDNANVRMNPLNLIDVSVNLPENVDHTHQIRASNNILAIYVQKVIPLQWCCH